MPDSVLTRPGAADYELVLFDMDGTLLDSGKAHQEMFARFWPPRRLGRGEIRGDSGPTIWDVFVPSGISREDMEQIYEQLDDFYRHEVGDIVSHLRFVPQAASVLSALRQAGVKTALVSNSHAALVDEIVAENEAGPLFSLVSGSTFAEQDKPERLLAAAAELGVPENRTLYVGDNESDGRTARRIGMDSAIVLSSISWLHSAEDLLARVKPTYIVFELSRILNIVL